MARRQNPKIERTLKRTSSLRLVKQTFFTKTYYCNNNVIHNIFLSQEIIVSLHSKI